MAAIETSVDRSGFRMQPTSRSPPVSSGVLPSADTSTDIHARASMDRAESRTSSTYTSMRPLSAFQPLEMGVEANRPSSQMLNQDTRHASNSSSVSSSMPQLTFKSADLRSALHLHEAQKHKLYMEGYLLVRHALSVDGQPAHRPDQFRSWTECFVQLNGTILSIWESSALAKAESEGREVPPSFVNITDAMVDFIGLHVEAQFSEPGRRRALYHVFAVNSAGSNRILFCYSTPPPCESSLVEQRLSAKYQNHPDQERVVNWLNTGHRFLQAWINAMRLASWERSRLDEIYTGALIRARLSAVRNMQGTTMQQSDDHAELLVRSPLLRGRHEGYVRARFMGSTEWRMCWMVLQSHWSEDEPVSGIRRLLKRNAGDRSSLLSLGSHSHQGNGMSDAQEPPPPPDKSIASPAVAYFYDSKKAKKPFASLWHVRNVYAVYPSRPDLVEGSILFKVEGCLPQSTVLSATHRPRKTGWVMFMPEVKHSHVGQANAEMMKWIIAFMDAFHLYGRPGAFAWDARNPVSPFFAYPIGPYKDHLFLDRALAEFLDVTIEDHLSTRQELHDIMAARMRGENTMLLPPLPMQSPTTVSRQPTQVARAVHAEVQAAREAQQIPTTPGGYQDAYYALTGSQDAPPPSLPSVSSPVISSARLPQDSSTSESKQQVAVPSNMQSTQDTSAVASPSFAQATNPDLMSHADAEHQVQQQMDAIAHAQAQEEYEAQRQALAKLEQEAEAQAQAKARAQAELEAHNRSVQQQTARLQAEQLAKSQGDREASSRRHYDQQLLQEQQAKERTRAEFSARTSLDLKHAGHVPINTPRTQPLTVSASAFQSRQRPGANTNVALADEGQERAVIGENAVDFAGGNAAAVPSGGNAVALPMAEPAAASSAAVPAATAFAALPKAQSAQFTPAQYLPTESSVPKSATEEPQHRPPLQLNQLSLDESHLSSANHSNEHRLPTNNASSTSASVLKPAIRTTSSGVASTAPTSISLSVSRSDINHAGTSLEGPQVYNPRHEQVYPWPIRRESQENSVNVDDTSIVSQVNSDFHATNQYTELSPINEQLTDPPSAKPSSHSNYSTSTMRPAEQYSATSKNPFSAASLQSFSLKSSKQSPTTTPLSPALPSNLSFLAPTATFPGQNPSQSTTVHQQRVPSEQLSNRILDEYFDDLQASHTNASAPATHAVVTPISARKQLDDEPNPSLAADGTEHQPYEEHGENARLTAQLDDDLDEDQDVYGDPNAPSTQSMYPSSFGHKSNAAINATHTIAQSRPGRPMHVSNSNGSQDWVDHDESDWSRSMTQDPATQRETDSGPNLRKSVGKSPYRNGTPTIPPSDSHGNLTSSERNGVSSITPSQSQRMSLAPIAPAMTLNASTASLGEEMPQSQSQSQLHSYTTPFPRPTSGFAGSYARSNHSASSLGLYQNKAGSSSSLHLDRPRATFVKLDHEDPRLAKQKYMPQGLLASASQERLDRRAQDHESRSNGAVLVNMPPKPPPPQAGLMGAIHGRSQTGSSPDRRSESAPNSTRLGASSAGNMTPSASQQQMMMNMYYWQQQQQMMMMMMGGGMMPANREQYPMQAQQQAMQAAQQAYMQALAQANGGNMPAGMPAGMPTGMPAGMPTGMPTGMPAGMPAGMPNFYGMPNYADPSWSRPMTSSSSRDSFLSAPPRMSVAESRTSRTSPRSSPRSSHHGR